MKTGSLLRCSLLLVLALRLESAPAATNTSVLWPGLQPDGSMLLPNQWSLRPAGKFVDVGDFPVNIAVHPDSRLAAMLHCGFGAHEVILVDLLDHRIISRHPVAEAFYGLVFSRDGRQLFCSGAGGETVHAFDLVDGKLTPLKDISLRPGKEKGVPCGLAIDPAGEVLYVANLWDSQVTHVSLVTQETREIPLVNKSILPQDNAEPSNEDFDTAAATKRAKAARRIEAAGEVFPYGCALDAKRKRLYVSLWGAASIAVVDTGAGKVIGRWPTGAHPCEVALRKDGKYLFAANANDNTVTVLATKDGRAVETLWATLFPNSPRGATPNSLALSPNQELLFVANANINAVAVFDVSKPGKSRSLGFIPTGWYPTSVRVTPDGKQLLIANGKGNTALANPDGPQPGLKRSREQYIGGLLKGTLSVIELPPRDQLEHQLALWTAEVLKCTPLREDASVSVARPEGNPIPGKPGDPCPITHCIYIIKENRTYDQIFGDMPQGNGDSNLCLFPQSVTPNHHKLASEFVLLDNFYAESEVSADGHEWSMAAYATDFVEKTWPMNYGHGKSGKFPYPSEGNSPIAAPASGYLWDRASEAGVTYRSYGEFVQNPSSTNRPVTTRNKTLENHIDPWFRSFDLDYGDTLRADRFISELKRFEGEGEMPRLQIVRLPNDHTHGASIGKRTPTAFVAENDLALGMIVEAVSRSKFWASTAIFVVEDDAQNGPDHVDAHRTVALVVSPYTRRGFVDSTLYSTTSMLRTIELILGMKPMTQFDAAAAPMFNSFQPQANLQPYTGLPSTVDLHAINGLHAWGGNLKLNFAKEDAIDDSLFSEVIWRAVKGNGQPMPAPVHAGFVLARTGEKED